MLKQQYGNFKAEGSETLEQTFNRLQAIVSQLEFLDVPVEQEDLNQKFLTSLSPEWLMHTIVWRNRNDLDTMSSQYDLYNHLKVEDFPEVQKREDQVLKIWPSLSLQITTVEKVKFPLLKIDDDDIEEMDIKWNMALLSMRTDRFWKKTSKKITIQGSDVAGFDKSKVECFNCHKMGHFSRECRATKTWKKSKKERDGIDSKLEKFVNSSKDLDQMLESQKSGKDKKGVGFDEYRVVPPPPAQVYSSPMPDLSWTGLPEFADNTEPTAKYAELYRNITQSSNVRSNNFGPPIIEDWDSEDESDTESTPIESIRSTINQNRDQPRGNQRN
ncbi:putative ribonuclease H-like domain-containing protein [Tanacetum coccineum]